ncbi:MAG: hypothetical protein GYA15_07520 [Leptolinea sp.]|jgi:hypothetical protein|nr:hypothetical protein [Leptolinea sp.]
MRKVLIVLLISILVTGCSIIPAAKPTLTTEEMATKVAVLLTSMPTNTAGVPEQQPMDLSAVSTPMETPTEGEIGAIATPTEPLEELATPTTDPTELAALNQPLATETTAPTATPPIAMPSETPTITSSPTITPGGPSLPAFQVTATFTASDPRSLLPIPTWTDTMDNGKNWPIGADAYTAVDFQNGYMILTGLQKDNGWRLAVNDVDNAYFETTARFGAACHGMDKWGMMLRSPDRNTADKGYWFNITCDGKFAFQKWNAEPPENEKSVTNLIAWTTNSNIKPGANSINRIGVLAKGSHFTLYINGVEIGEITDASYDKGGFGILIGARETERFNIYVDEMSYWLNPPL